MSRAMLPSPQAGSGLESELGAFLDPDHDEEGKQLDLARPCPNACGIDAADF
jgi:hypothetical protein